MRACSLNTDFAQMSEMPASSRLPAVMTDASTLSPMATSAAYQWSIDLFQRHHIGHVGLHGGNLRRPAVHQFAVLVGEHILSHRIQCAGGYGTAETAKVLQEHFWCCISHDCSRTFFSVLFGFKYRRLRV